MGRFVAERVLLAIPTMLLATSVTFLLLTVSAGNYVPGLALSPDIGPDDIQRLRSLLGLDQPLYVQYFTWLGNVLQGNFGSSMVDGTPVAKQLFDRLPNTLLLSGSAITLGLVFAVPVGVVSALRRGSRLDSGLNAAAVAGFALPQFWLALILVSIFSIGLHGLGLPAFPAGGASDPARGGDVLDRLQHLVLPAVALSLPYIAIWSRYMRSSVLTVLTQDYVRTARAKGLRERRVIYVHALRNALTPLIVIIGLELPRLISGSVVIEVVFGWPGVGRYAYERALSSDITAVLGVTTLFAAFVVIGNVLADVIQSGLDPRTRAS